MIEENGYYGYADQQAYMEQEEEWEREGLLDPAWEKQQKKVSALPQHQLICIYLLIWHSLLSTTRIVSSYQISQPQTYKLPLRLLV